MASAKRERATTFCIGVLVCSVLSTSLGFIARANNGVLSGGVPRTVGKSKAITISSMESGAKDKGHVFGLLTRLWGWKEVRLNDSLAASVHQTVNLTENVTENVRVADEKKAGNVTVALACIMGIMVVALTGIGAVMVGRGRRVEGDETVGLSEDFGLSGDVGKIELGEGGVKEVVEEVVGNVLDEVVEEKVGGNVLDEVVEEKAGGNVLDEVVEEKV